MIDLLMSLYRPTSTMQRRRAAEELVDLSLCRAAVNQ